jgi:hypothetical protein
MIVAGVSTVTVLLAAGNVHASGALSQGFPTTDASLTAGSLAVLHGNGTSSTAEKATSEHASQLIGVVADQPLIAISNSGRQVQVVTSGITAAAVSDINGAVKVGDKITASPIEGVGMKALTSTQIVGTAETNLKDSANSITKTLTDVTGKSSTVHIGTVQLQVNVSYYVAPQSRLSAIVPTFLVNLGSSIAGKDLSPLRVLIGFSSLIIGFIIAGIMLQTAVRSGIISLGRNPLAHNMLRRGLIDVMVTSVAVLLITIATFYLILKI